MSRTKSTMTQIAGPGNYSRHYGHGQPDESSKAGRYETNNSRVLDKFSYPDKTDPKLSTKDQGQGWYRCSLQLQSPKAFWLRGRKREQRR